VPQPLASKIMVIRHAEKPNGTDAGVSPTGLHDKAALSVRGWQRAGALVALFSPPPGISLHPSLATPRFLFASMASSQRPLQTLVPLSEKLRLPVSGGHRGQEEDLVRQVTACDGPVLISWQREQIPPLAKLLLAGSPDEANCPANWPAQRFDVTWIFDLESGVYRFSQLPHRLLAGDSDSPIEK
jgi:hypothetical protein